MSAAAAQSLIFYNGQTGSLGSHLGPLLAETGTPGHPLASRLENPEGLAAEVIPRLRASTATHGVLIQLAAYVSVPACEKNPELARRINVTDTVRTVRAFVLACREAGRPAHVVYASTGHVYATAAPGTRVNELSPTVPRSVYARSKLEAERELAQLAKEMGFSLRIARIFGLLAPRQAAHFVLPGLIQRVQDGRFGEIPGLSFARDYLDARDVAWSLVAMAEDLMPGTETLNVCLGEPVTIRDLLAEVLRCTGQTELLERATEGPGRPDDVSWIVGDPTQFSKRYGFPSAQIDWRHTVAEAVASFQ